MKTTLLIPTLNEAEGVKAIMPRIKKEWVDEILIVDGNSTDGTREYLQSNGYNVITQKKPGVVAAWWEGFEAATGDVIILFSPDNNSIPELIPALVDKMKEGYAMAIASRYAKGAKSYDDSILTGFGNFLFTRVIINGLFGAKYTDALVMYRAFKKELLTTLKMRDVKGPFFEAVLSIRCAKKKLKVMEIPGDEPTRIGGNASRAWPGLFGRWRAGAHTLRGILNEFFFGL